MKVICHTRRERDREYDMDRVVSWRGRGDGHRLGMGFLRYVPREILNQRNTARVE